VAPDAPVDLSGASGSPPNAGRGPTKPAICERGGVSAGSFVNLCDPNYYYFRQLDDAEFEIPAVAAPPSLESILAEADADSDAEELLQLPEASTYIIS